MKVLETTKACDGPIHNCPIVFMSLLMLMGKLYIKACANVF